MILHTLISASTLTHGGKTSPGKERVDIPTEMHHLTGEALIAKLRELQAEGYALTLSVLAHRDRRKPQVQAWYPANVCPECLAARMTDKENRHDDG